MSRCPYTRRVGPVGAKHERRCDHPECPVCGEIRRRDLVRVFSGAFDAAGAIAAVTITAPGTRDLPPGDDRMAAYNADEHLRWSDLHAAAQRYTRAATGRIATLAAHVRALQRRGALHRHLGLVARTEADLAAVAAYLRYVSDHLAQYGFGGLCVGRTPAWTPGQPVPVVPAHELGRLATYFAQNAAEGMPPIRARGGTGVSYYASAALKRLSGVTRASLRAVRRRWCRTRTILVVALLMAWAARTGLDPP